MRSMNGFDIELAGWRGFVYRDERDEVHIPSVTQVLNLIPKPALVDWAARTAASYVADRYNPSMSEGEVRKMIQEAATAHKRRRDESQVRGIDKHKWIGRMLTGEEPAVGEVGEQVQKILSASKNVKLEPLIVGNGSGRPTYAGFADAVIEYEFGPDLVLEIKTSKAVYPNHLLQLAAYAKPLKATGALLLVNDFGVKLYELDALEIAEFGGAFDKMVEAWFAIKQVEDMIRHFR